MQGCFKLTAFFDGNSGLNFNASIALSEEAGFTPGNILIADRDYSSQHDDTFVIGIAQNLI